MCAAFSNSHQINPTGGARTPCATTMIQLEGRTVHSESCIAWERATHTQLILAPIGDLQVGRVVNMCFVRYQRKQVGPKYKGTMLFMTMLQHNVMPERVDNFYACAAISDTSVKYVRVQDLCTLLAEVAPRTESPNMINLVPIAQAFPVSWCVE